MNLWDIFVGFLGDLLASFTNDILTGLQNAMGDLFYVSFYIEQMPGLSTTVLTSASISAALRSMYGFLVLLLTAKLLWKGSKVYVLWRDGEAETPPGEMVVGAAFALISSVAFPYLYEFGVDISRELINAVCRAMFGTAVSSNATADSAQTVIMEISKTSNAAPLLSIVLALIFVLLFVWLMFIMLKQGAEMLIFRLGVPIAAVGLIDSDGGSWKPYTQAFFRQIFTTMARHFCMLLSANLIVGMSVGGCIIAIAFMVIAIAMPAILSQFMAPKSGGGMSQKLYSVGMALRSFRGK